MKGLREGLTLPNVIQRWSIAAMPVGCRRLTTPVISASQTLPIDSHTQRRWSAHRFRGFGAAEHLRSSLTRAETAASSAMGGLGTQQNGFCLEDNSESQDSPVYIPCGHQVPAQVMLMGIGAIGIGLGGD